MTKRKRHSASNLIGLLVWLLLILLVLYIVTPRSSAGIRLKPAKMSMTEFLSQLALGIQFCHWDFTIKDAASNVGLANVRIEIVWEGFGTQFTCYTDSSGHASANTAVYQWVYIDLTLAGYDSKHLGPFDSRVASLTFSWQMQQSTTPPTGANLLIYAQADSKNWQLSGKAVYNGHEYLLDVGTDPAKVLLWTLPVNTPISIQFSGYYMQSPGVAPNFDYTRSFTTGTDGTTLTYWLDVLTGEVQSGRPPTPPVDPIQWLWDFLSWAGQNLILVIGIGVFLYALLVFFPILQPIFGYIGGLITSRFSRDRSYSTDYDPWGEKRSKRSRRGRR